MASKGLRQTEQKTIDDNNIILMFDMDNCSLSLGGDIVDVGMNNFIFRPTSEFTCSEGRNFNVKLCKDDYMPCDLIVNCKKCNETDFEFTIVEKKDEKSWNYLFRILSHM